MQPSSSNPGSNNRPVVRHSFRNTGAKRKKPAAPSRLRGIRPFDQHGRPWYVETEAGSGFPTGRWQPLFDAPWYPDQIYFRVNVDNPTEMYIDYPAMRTDRREANAGYHREAVKFASEHKYPAPVYGQPYPQEIINSIGNPPQPIQPIVAAEQEHPWIMGWDHRPDPRLVPFMPRRRTALTVEEEGYDFSEASYENTLAHLPKRVKSFADLPTIVGGAAPEPTWNEQPIGEDVAGAEDEIADDAEPILDEDAAQEVFGTLGDNEEALLDLEDEIDPDHTGGQKVPIQTAPKRASAERRPPKPAPSTFKKGGRAKPGSKGKTLAQGARPVIAPLDDD